MRGRAVATAVPPSGATMVPIDSVVMERACYPRVLNDKTHEPFYLIAHRYKLALMSGAVFPPIVLTKLNRKNILVDGFNRLLAHKKLNRTEILAEFVVCKNFAEVLYESLRRNVNHGQPLSPFEIKTVCLALTKGKSYSLADISRGTTIPLETLKTWMSRDVQKIKSGREIVTKVMLRNVSVKHIHDGEQQNLAARSQVTLINQLISLIENNLLNIDNKDVIDRLYKLGNLLNSFHAGR